MAGIDNRRLLRATLSAAARGPVGPLVSELFAAMWGRPEALITPADVVSAASRAGITDMTEAELDDPRWDAAVTHATDQAIADGVFGAPTIFVGDEMFFGNDRLPFVRAALERTA